MGERAGQACESRLHINNHFVQAWGEDTVIYSGLSSTTNSCQRGTSWVTRTFCPSEALPHLISEGEKGLAQSHSEPRRVGLGAKSPGTQDHPAEWTTRWAGVGLGGRAWLPGTRVSEVSAARHTEGGPGPCLVGKAAARGSASSAEDREPESRRELSRGGQAGCLSGEVLAWPPSPTPVSL